jgi:hypothetical protein
MKPTAWKLSASFIASAVLLTSCEDKEQTKRVKELEEERVDLLSQLENMGTRLEEAETERNTARGEKDQAQRDARGAADKLADVQRQLEHARKSEQALRDSTRSKAVANPIEDAKKLITENLPAVWLIEGDQGTSRGVAAEADGKTWLYMPATALGGSAKLTVKDADGNTVTKFGDFQIAADANLARLEIKQDVPKRFVIDPKSALAENPRLILASPGAGGSGIKLTESQPGPVTATGIEFSAYETSEILGFPLFHGETGALIGIVIPSQRPAASLWEAPQPSESGLPLAARLNRTIDWKPSTIGSLLAERRKIEELKRMTQLVEAAASLTPGTSGLNLDATLAGGTQTARQIFDANKSLPVVQELLKLNENLSSQKVRLSESDIKRQVGSVFGQLGTASRRSATEMRAMKPSPCNRAEMENILKWYDEAEKHLAATLAGTGR